MAKVSLSYPPLGLGRNESATYGGCGTTSFDEMVADGRMPKPRKIGTRSIWLRPELDASADNLPVAGEDADTNPWDTL